MDRKLYKIWIKKESPPPWTCPTCGKGNLQIKKDSFHFSETSKSKKAHEDPEWWPGSIQYVYNCLLKCANDACKEVVVSSGEGCVEQEYGYDHEGKPTMDYIDYFQPNYFYPCLKLFSIQKGVPDEVVEEIDQSFELFFCNPSSSLNHLRIALENLLTYLGVKRYKIENNKRSFIFLHSRINMLPVKFKEIKEHCLAIKWVGNAGSHSSKEITMDDVLDAYEIMDEVLREVFKTKKKEVKKLVKQINKKRGPKGKSRKKGNS